MITFLINFGKGTFFVVILLKLERQTFFIMLGLNVLIVTLVVYTSVESYPQMASIFFGDTFTGNPTLVFMGKSTIIRCQLYCFYAKVFWTNIFGFQFDKSSEECHCAYGSSSHTSDGGTVNLGIYSTNNDLQYRFIYASYVHEATSVKPTDEVSIVYRMGPFHTQYNRELNLFASTSMHNNRADATVKDHFINTCGSACTDNKHTFPTPFKSDFFFGPVPDGLKQSSNSSTIKVKRLSWESTSSNDDLVLTADYKIGDNPDASEIWLEFGGVVEEHMVFVTRSRYTVESTSISSPQLFYRHDNEYYIYETPYVDGRTVNAERIEIRNTAKKTLWDTVVTIWLPFQAVPTQHISEVPDQQSSSDFAYLSNGFLSKFAAYRYHNTTNSVTVRIPYLDPAVPTYCHAIVVWKIVEEIPEMNSGYWNKSPKSLATLSEVSMCTERACTNRDVIHRKKKSMHWHQRYYGDYTRFRIMHQRSGKCIKPNGDGRVILGSCDNVHVWGPGGSIQNEKTGKFINGEQSSSNSLFYYTDIPHASQLGKYDYSFYNTTIRTCLSYIESSTSLVSGGTTAVSHACPFSIDTKFTTLPAWDHMNEIYLRSILAVTSQGIDYLFVCNPGGNLVSRANCFYSTDGMSSWTRMTPMITTIAFLRTSEDSIYGMSHKAKRKFKLNLPPRSNHVQDVKQDDFYNILNGIDYKQTSRLDELDYDVAPIEIDGISGYGVSSRGLFIMVGGSWKMRFLFDR